MEDDKKKKKNRKKKGKQTKISDVSSVTDGETTLIEQNHSKQISGDLDIQTSNSRALESEDNLDRHQINGAENHNHNQLDIMQASYGEKITQLQTELDSCMKREESLKENVVQLQIDKASRIQTEGDLQKKIFQFENEKDSWLQKEAALEDKVKNLHSEKESWAFKESLAREVLTKVEGDRMGLEIRVKELEEAKDHLLQENQQLIETISVLESHIQNFAKDVPPSETSTAEMDLKVRDANAQMEEAKALVQKLVKENAELVEKVNELHVQLHQHSNTSSVPTQDIAVVIPESSTVTDHISELSEKLPESTEILEYTGTNQNEETRRNTDYSDMRSIVITKSQTEESKEIYEANEIEEIVQVSLDDNQINELEPQDPKTDENEDIPITDAPLIGAPFRFISFVAKYVSGADLVNK